MKAKASESNEFSSNVRGDAAEMWDERTNRGQMRRVKQRKTPSRKQVELTRDEEDAE